MVLRRASQVSVVAAIFVAGGWPFVAADEPDMRRDSVVVAVEKAAPAVVNIATEHVVEYRDPFQEMFSEFFGPYHRRATRRSLGSGVLVDELGHLVTNFHVVQRASKITVVLNDGAQLEGRFLSGNESSDLALAKVTRQKPFSYVTLGRDDDVYLGETVVAIGNPLGFGNSVSRGIVSSKNRAAVDGQGNVVVDGVLQTDAAINPGNSGGPLINVRGELIGINTAIVQQAQNIGFAIPVKRVSALLADWLSPEKSRRLWLGARFKQEDNTVIVSEVAPDSPAAKARVQVGDVVVKVDNQDVDSIIGLMRRLLTKEAGQRVKFHLRRDGIRTAEVTLAELPAYSGNELAWRKLGLRFQELTADLARALAVPAARGVVVADVDTRSDAWGKGIRRGHVIARIRGSDIKSLDDIGGVLEDVAVNSSIPLLVVSGVRRGPVYEEHMTVVYVLTR